MSPAAGALTSHIAFSVGPGGALVGEDGYDGLLAASLRYVCRLAKALGGVLDLGDLSHVESNGRTSVIARVNWDLAGECLLRGQVIVSPWSPGSARDPEEPGSTQDVESPEAGPINEESGVDDAVDACLADLEAHDSVAWTALVRRDLPLLQTGAAPAAATLGQVGLRALGILGGFDPALRETCVWLGFDYGTLVLTPLGPHCLIVSVDTQSLDAAALLSTLLQTKARLARHDLTTASTASERAETAASQAGYDSEDEDGLPPVNDLPLTGARFAGATGEKARQRGQARWLRGL